MYSMGELNPQQTTGDMSFEPDFAVWLERDARELDKRIEDEKTRHPEKSYQEIARDIVETELTETLETTHGTTLTIGPWSRFVKTKLPEGAKMEKIAQEAINFYTNEFDKLFALQGDYKNLPAVVKKYGKVCESLLNTDFEKLERTFNDLVTRYIPQLHKRELVGERFTAGDIYAESADNLLLIINAILIEHMKYDFEVATSDAIGDASNMLSLDNILLNGTGVCRHFALLASMLFETIKRSAKRSINHEDKSTFLLDIPDSPMDHGYNAALKISREGDITLCLLDPTYANTFLGNEQNSPSHIDALDYTATRKGRVLSLQQRVLPDFLSIKSSLREEKNSLLQLFERYHRCTEAFDPFRIKTYDTVKDVIETIFSAPTGEQPLRKYCNALIALAKISAQEQSLSLSMSKDEKKKVENFMVKFMKEDAEIIKALTETFEREKRYERENNNFFLWEAVKKLEGTLYPSDICPEAYPANELFRSLVVHLSEYTRMRIELLAEKIGAITDMDDKEKALLFDKNVQEIISPISVFFEHITLPVSLSPEVADSSFEYVFKFEPIGSNSSDFLKPLLTIEASSYIGREREKVSFYQTLQRNFQKIEDIVRETIERYDPTATMEGNYAIEIADDLERTSILMRPQECAKPIVRICEEKLNFAKEFGSARNISKMKPEELAAKIVGMVKMAYTELSAIAVKEGALSWERRQEDAVIEHESIMHLIKECVLPLPLGNYRDLEPFIKKQREEIKRIKNLFFNNSSEQYNRFMNNLIAILDQTIKTESMVAAFGEQRSYSVGMFDALRALVKSHVSE